MARSVMRVIINILLYALIFHAVFLCTSDDNIKEAEENLNFVSLTADSDSLHYGQSTVITAEADGTAIKYKWHAERGEIEGSGYRIIFRAACTCPFDEVSCTVSDRRASITRSVTITLY